MTNQDGKAANEDGTLTDAAMLAAIGVVPGRPTRSPWEATAFGTDEEIGNRPRHHSPRLALAPVKKAPIARPGGVSLKPTGAMSLADVEDDDDWGDDDLVTPTTTPDAAPEVPSEEVTTGDWDEVSEDDEWETPKTVPSLPSAGVTTGDWDDVDDDEEGDWETPSAPLVAPVAPVSTPAATAPALARVVPLRPVSPAVASAPAPTAAAAPAAVVVEVPKPKSSTPRGPSSTPLASQRYRKGTSPRRSRPLQNPRLQPRDAAVLTLISIMRVTTSQHLIAALANRASTARFAMMESAAGTVPLSPAVLDKRLGILARSGLVVRWVAPTFGSKTPKPCWIATNKVCRVLEDAPREINPYAGWEITGMNTRSSSVLETSLQHHLHLSHELGRLTDEYIGVPDFVVKKAVAEAVAFNDGRDYCPQWDASWMMVAADAAHLAINGLTAPLIPDLTVLDVASNDIAFYVEVECSPKPLPVLKSKVQAYAASGKVVYFLVGTTATQGSRDVALIERRLTQARTELRLPETLVRIERADLAWGTTDPAGYAAAQQAAAA